MVRYVCPLRTSPGTRMIHAVVQEPTGTRRMVICSERDATNCCAVVTTLLVALEAPVRSVLSTERRHQSARCDITDHAGRVFLFRTRMI